MAEVGTGLLAAFFAGRREGSSDVAIWLSRFDGHRWLEPLRVADGRSDCGATYPCWNPVLYRVAADEVLLFYKVGPNCADWWGMVRRSADAGATWSSPQRLPDGVWGPIKNKPVQLENGLLLCPSSTELDGWRVHVETTADFGETWSVGQPLQDPDRLDAIQPTILVHTPDRLQMLCRTKSGCLATSWSADGGRSWGALQATALPNPNSGIDAVRLRDGRSLLIYNHSARTRSQWGGPRTPLNIALSNDGVQWYEAAVIERLGGEYSYPAVIQDGKGSIHIVYTWKRERIRHVVVEPQELEAKRPLEAISRGGASQPAGADGFDHPPWDSKSNHE